MLRRLFPNPPGPAPSPAPTPTSSTGPGDPIDRIVLSHATHTRLDLRNRRLDDVNANQAKFIECDFSYSVFDRAYLRSATFERCKFVGCRFYDSNLRRTRLHACEMAYATFHRTLVEPKELLANLPIEPNLRRDSLRNLRANAVEIGDYQGQRRFVLAEVEAAMDHLGRAARGSSDYYRRKYPTWQRRLRARLALVGLKIGGLVWGHGERPARMIWSAAVLIAVLTLVNMASVLPRLGWTATDSGLEVLKYSVDQFLDAQPEQKFKGFPLVDYALLGLRYVYIGLFISVLSKSISHR